MSDYYGTSKDRPRAARVIGVGFALGIGLSAIPGPGYAADGQADLSVSTTDSNDPAGIDGPLYYTVTVINNDADDTATDVTLTDVVADKPGSAIPLLINITPTQGARISDAVPSQGSCVVDNVVLTPSVPPVLFSRPYGERVTCELGTIAAGASATVTIEVDTNLNTFVVLQDTGVIANVATVSSATTDPDPADNTDVEDTTLFR